MAIKINEDDNDNNDKKFKDVSTIKSLEQIEISLKPKSIENIARSSLANNISTATLNTTTMSMATIKPLSTETNFCNNNNNDVCESNNNKVLVTNNNNVHMDKLCVKNNNHHQRRKNDSFDIDSSSTKIEQTKSINKNKSIELKNNQTNTSNEQTFSSSSSSMSSLSLRKTSAKLITKIPETLPIECEQTSYGSSTNHSLCNQNHNDYNIKKSRFLLIKNRNNNNKLQIKNNNNSKSSLIYDNKIKTSSSCESSRLRQEKKAARQLGVILGAFILCWMPYIITYVVTAYCTYCISLTVHQVTIWLGYLNSFLNPFLYALCNENFKHAFKKMLGRLQQPQHISYNFDQTLMAGNQNNHHQQQQQLQRQQSTRGCANTNSLRLITTQQ
ncbi:Histamine H1 receptor [Dermatophagoides pteronyssinus]|uniref:Histamine H1 receptor n=1 Tax=Dermatophagoides pteronyssinus TaxID=6956 RepID=A0ABQ8J121_DERPT|nr:Histamine H1 receptor [Dermatophagoides pteronyssinus]